MNETVETPSQTLAKAETAQAMDARGRLITVKRLNALQYYRLSRALGSGSAANPATMDLAMLVCTVCRIDVDDISFPASERDVEFLIQKLDFDGIAAVSDALKKLNADADSEVDAAKN